MTDGKMPLKPLASAPERIKMARAVEISGETDRTLQAAAAAGLIPGAAKPFKCWTFDETQLRAWLKAKERKAWQSGQTKVMADRQPTRSSGAASGGRGSRSTARNSEEAYRLAMARLRGKEPATGATAR
jgi:hypothetical protein